MLAEKNIQLAENIVGYWFKDSLGIYHWGIRKQASNGNMVSLAHGATRTSGYCEDDDEAAIAELIAKHFDRVENQV